MYLIELDLKPRDIVTAEAIDNALALDMAMGGSTNTVLHTLALCQEAEIDYPLERLNEVSQRVPHLCKVSPASHWHIEDVHEAGGISAILAELVEKAGYYTRRLHDCNRTDSEGERAIGLHHKP